MSTAEAVTALDNSGRRRFEIFVGDERAGVAMYEQIGAVRTFTHTIIDPKFEHRGLGGILARSALDDARAHSYEVVPQCPFIAAYIRRHPDYTDLLPDSVRSRFDAGANS